MTGSLPGLTGLRRRLKVNGHGYGFILRMGGLEELELEWVEIDSTVPLAGLANLKEFNLLPYPGPDKSGILWSWIPSWKC